MLTALGMFALGSALCGSAKNMNWLIAARSMFYLMHRFHHRLMTIYVAIQGAGGGGILAVTSIIISDLVPLTERAMYNGMIGM